MKNLNYHVYCHHETGVTLFGSFETLSEAKSYCNDCRHKDPNHVYDITGPQGLVLH